MLKLLFMTCILTAAECACGGGGPASVAPQPMNAAVVGTAAVAPQGAFAVVGDSISAGHYGSTFPDFNNAWPAFAAAMVGRSVVNVSFYGGQEPSMAKNQVPLIPSDVTTVVYEGGSNDVSDSAAPDDVALVARIAHMITTIRQYVPGAQIVLMTVRHLGQGRTDDAIAQVPGGWTYAQLFHREMVWNNYLRSLGLPVIDVQDLDVDDTDLAYPDGVHPSLAQAHVLAQLAAPLLR